MKQRQRAKIAAIVALALPLALSSCGTRLPHSAVVAAADGGAAPSSNSGGTTAGGVTTPGASTSAPGVTTPSSSAPTTGTSIVPGSGESPGKTTGGSGAGTPAGQQTQAAGTSHTCAKQGSPIVYGQVGTFSGIIGGSIGSAVDGLKIWAAATNAVGGIACHPVVVDSIDDGGDNGSAQSGVEQLVQDDHAVAINAFTPITTAGIEPYIDQHRVPVVGGDLLSSAWYTDKNFFPQGGPLQAVLYAISRYAVLQGGTKYSFFYCIEASPCTQCENMLTKQGIAAKAGLHAVGDQPISLAGSNFTQQCATAKSKGANVIFIGAGVSAVNAIGRDCASQNYHPIYLALSLGVTNSQQSDPNLQGLAIGSVQFPWMATGTPALTAYHDALARYAPTLDDSGGAAAGWTSGELFERAILNLGSAAYGNITSADVIKGLAMIHNNNLGGLVGGHLNFHANAPATLDSCVFVAVISKDKWAPAQGGRAICEP